METKNPEERNLRRNSSDTLSLAFNSTNREYVFSPVSYRIKVALFIAMLSFGVYGLIANSLKLYFKHKKQRRRRHGIQRSFSRSLSEYFVRSLCVSDILCSLISLPLYSTEMFVHFVTKDWICRFTRFFITLFPVVTVLNLLVIGVERYLAVFHRFFVLRGRKAKKMVVGAWVTGAFITLISVVFVRLVKHDDVEEDFYTLVCKYDSSVPLYRAFFAIFTIISYIIPSLILTFINLRILKRQRDSRVDDGARTTQRAVSRLKVTRMFVSLIFAFIIPYMVIVLYMTFRRLYNPEFSLTDNYIIRHVSAFAIFTNGSVSATLMIFYEKLYLDFVSCFRPSSSRNDRSDETAQRQVPIPRKNTKKYRSSSV